MTSRNKALELIEQFCEILYEVNGTAAGAMNCAHLAAKVSQQQLGVGTPLHSFWGEVISEIEKIKGSR